MKMYILEKITYGDFDICQNETILLSADKQTLVEKAAEYNSNRSEKDIRDEVEFEVNPKAVKVI